MQHHPPFTLAGALALALPACGPGTPDTLPAPVTPAVVAGTVTYRERMALPPDAVVDVWVVDATPGIVTAMAVLAETSLPTGGRQVPIPFELPYDPARIDGSHAYEIKAAIRGGSEMLFSSGAGTRVITGGAPSRVDLVVQRPAAATPTYLVGTSWLLEDLAGAGVVDRVEATLEFPEPGRVAGNGSCNRFSGSVEIREDAIRFAALGSTRMACVEAVNAQEARYLEALGAAERYAVEATTLKVFVKGKVQPLRFTRREG